LKLSVCFAVLTAILSVSVAYAGTVTTLPQEIVTASSDKEDTTLLSPGTVTVVKPEEMSGEQKNLPELLKHVPGLHVVEARGRGAYTVASVRGSTAAEVSVFVDGTLMNLGGEAAVDLSAIPVDNVERIEVYRGYIPARFSGASMGGVINIITKKPVKPGGSVSVGGGSYGLFKSGLSYVSPLGKGKLLFGTNYEKTDGDFSYWNDADKPYTPSDGYNASRQNNGYKKADILIKWNDDHWQLRGGWKKDDRDLPYQAPGNDRHDSRPGAHQKTDTFDFSAARRQKSGNLEWGLKIDYINQDKKYDNEHEANTGGVGEVHNEYKNDRLGVTIDGSYSIGENNLLEFLADFSHEKLKAEGDITQALNAITDYSRDAWNLQLQDTINLNKEGSFWITPLLRYNASDGDGKFSWNVALSRKFGDHWTLKASGGQQRLFHILWPTDRL